jgi:hypothetical protein
MTDLHDELHRAAAGAGVDIDVDAVRARGDRLRRRRRTIRAVGGAVAAVALIAAALVAADRSDEHDLRTVDRPETSTPTTVPDGVVTSPPTSTASTTAASDAPAATTSTSATPVRTDSRRRVLEDEAGDATGEPPGSQPYDATLDLVALDIIWTGDIVTFVHVLAGPPTQQPTGADGRADDTWFRIPGKNLVHVAMQTYELDERVLIGVTGDGYMPPALRCTECTVELDTAANEVRIGVPVDTLNTYLREHDGGELRPGVTVSGWEVESRKEHTTRRYADEQESPHFYTASVMDRIRGFTDTWQVPTA